MENKQKIVVTKIMKEMSNYNHHCHSAPAPIPYIFIGTREVQLAQCPVPQLHYGNGQTGGLRATGRLQTADYSIGSQVCGRQGRS